MWIDWFGGGFESAAPAQIVGQVAGRDAVEAAHPLLETRMVGIDVVDVDVGLAGQRLSRGGNHADGNFGASGESAQRPAAVADQHVCRRHGARERLGDAYGRVLGQDGVGRGAGTVAGHENGDVVGKGARMSRLAAALAGLARQTGAPALEQFEDEGFVRFHNSLQRLRLVERRSAQEPMPPAIGRGRMDAAAFGRLGEADAVDHRLRLVEPAIFLAQSGHRPSRSRR